MQLQRPHYKKFVVIFSVLFLSACASYGTINNEKIEVAPSVEYSVRKSVHSHRSNQALIILAFSGGGTRAAALAYGVLEALRDTSIYLNGQAKTILSEVDVISSVSGGSFTAAYYGLYGDAIFTDFEDKFLYHNISGELIHGLLNPMMWFSKLGRTEMAVNYYEEHVFRGATFADLERQQGPLIVINASDLGSGVRFSFIQDYFNLLCSDLSTFPVARAVTASSAVPVLFNPVVLENHSGCEKRAQQWFESKKNLTSPQILRMVNGLRSYSRKDERRYIHLVDGGITDNLGLLAIYETIEVAGGAKQLLKSLGAEPAPYFLVISVNASTSPQYDMERSNKIPTLEDTINAVSDIQLHRYNDATLKLLQESIGRWSAELSTPEKPVTPYFVKIDFESISQSERKLFFNRIPTSYTLDQEQVDSLIEAGRELLITNTEFQRFTNDLGSE